MVLEEQFSSYEQQQHQKMSASGSSYAKQMKINDEDEELGLARSFKMPYQSSFRESDWSQLAEATLPLRTSRFLTDEVVPLGSSRRLSSPAAPAALAAAPVNYGGLARGPVNCSPAGSRSQLATSGSEPAKSRRTSATSASHLHFGASYTSKHAETTRKLILVNAISLAINLLLALVAFYFSLVNNSSSTTAFAADCLLDLISSAIVLWRYYGDDLSDVYMHAREQIACIYLGALFELSALGIIIKASSDIASGVEPGEPAPGYDVIYLAAAATVACSVLIVFKWHLYETVRDKSILLDVINTFVSTIFAVTLCLMTVLSNVDSSFWYFDPVLSIVLALFMAGFGLKVIHQNFHVLRPMCYGHNYQQQHQQPHRYLQDDPNAAPLGGSPFAKLPLLNRDEERMGLVVGKRNTPTANYGASQYDSNLNASVEQARRANWQKADYSSIAFV